MLYAATGANIGANGPGAMSGCNMLMNQGSLSSMAISCGPQWTPMFRWRAGNLTNRIQTNKWSRSISSPTDQKRPNPVQGQALPVDGAGVALPLIDQVHDIGCDESAF